MSTWPDPSSGSYIPFPRPIPAIVTDPASGTPQWSLCWSEDWNPAVMGALKALARPESYTGSETDVLLAADGGHQLLGSIKELCGGNFNPPAFYLVKEDVNCVVVPGDMAGRFVDNCGDVYFTWFGVGFFNLVGGVARVGARALDLIDDVQVGGHFCSVHAQALGSAANPATVSSWILNWIDCDGNPLEEVDSSGGDTFDFVDFVAQRVCLQVTGGDISGFCCTFTINGPVLCRYP